jgi:hypothetical protein
MAPVALIVLVFAFAFACFAAYKGSTSIRPTEFGWLAIALLILVQILFRGQEVFFK